MNEALEEPPTSAILLESCHFSQVIFKNVEKFYVPGADVACHYSLTEPITPTKKDWVGIFRVGWKTTREYYTFMWAPLPSDLSSDDSLQQQVPFKAYYLPKDDEYYQFCYVDQAGVVRGASVPFQFRAETEDDILVVTTQGEVEEIEQQNKDLLKENKELKETCSTLQKQNMGLQEELRKTQEKMKELDGDICFLQVSNLELRRAQDLQTTEISSAQIDLASAREQNMNLGKKNQEMQSILESLQSSREKLEQEANLLNEENQHLKAQNECKEAELHQLKEEHQNVSSDKERLENKLRATLGHMDQIQAQILNQKKEMESLARGDHDKTTQLERLKEETRLLRTALVAQHKGADLIKELEERTRLLQVLQKNKEDTDEENQRLRQENEELLRRLPNIPRYSSFAAAASSPVEVPTQTPENLGLIFGNPYCTPPEPSAIDAPSMMKCPLCNEVFPGNVETSQYEAHVRSHLLECPYCDETFEESNKQVYEDHLFCHGLDKL